MPSARTTRIGPTRCSRTALIASDPRSDLGRARQAHLLAAEICRDDFRRLRLWAKAEDGTDYADLLRLPLE